MQGISVVIPALDEAPVIGLVVEKARAAALEVTQRVQVIVVDDGSSDGTGAVAAQAGAEVIRHRSNRGYGAALRSGFAAAALQWTFLVDGDDQFDPAELRLLVERADHADMIAGIRVHRSDNSLRRFGGRAWNRLCRVLFGDLGEDIDCAFKLIRTDLVQSLPLGASGAAISVELFLGARASGARVVQLPVSHFPRRHGRASGVSLRVLARALVELIVLRVRGLSTGPVEALEESSR